MFKVDMDEGRALAAELPLLHERLVRAGFLRTGHKMHEVVREIGWELATFTSQVERRPEHETERVP